MSNHADPAREHAGRSIAGSIFALVIASVLVATAIFFVVTFSGPPPMELPHGIESIAGALRNGGLSRDPGDRLKIQDQATAPGAGPDQRDNPVAAARIASLLNVPAGDVIALTSTNRRGPPDGFVGAFTFGLRTASGWRVVEAPPSPLFKRWHWVTLGAMLAAILLLSIPAWASARAISRPLRRLAAAADQARAGAALAPLPATGSREVRDLSRAVQTMHARLAGHAEGRTTMLAAIAHDLGTPLSRIAFWIEQLPEPGRTRAAADIDEMRAMIGSALAFARDEVGQQTATRIDLGSLLDSLVEDMRVAGAPVTIEPGPRAIVRGDSGALRRLFANLVENAIRYGDSALVGWRIDDERVEVTIDDRGPGIDPATVERLFEPFVRGDPSRNRATGGTGLGLAIVRSIAVRHGGAVTLEPGAIGARARVTLPISG